MNGAPRYGLGHQILHQIVPRDDDAVFPEEYAGDFPSFANGEGQRPCTKLETPLMERQSMSAALPSNSVETKLTRNAGRNYRDSLSRRSVVFSIHFSTLICGVAYLW